MTKSKIRMAVLILGLATALIHLGLNFAGFQPLMLLNGLGYLVLTGLVYFDPPQVRPYRQAVHLGYIAYTAVTILAYFIIYPTPPWNVLGLFTKGIEFLLIFFLLQHMRTKQ